MRRFALTLVLLTAAAFAAAATPAAVVTQFCELDMQGARLGGESGNSDAIYKLVGGEGWDNEPGWDTATVVRGFRIVSSQVNGARATVTVEYVRLGIADAETINIAGRTESVQFQLRKVGSTYKIFGPVLNQHVSAATLRRHFVQSLGRAENDPIVQKLDQMIKQYPLVHPRAS